MADSPSTTNQTATLADKAIHALIFDVAVKAAEAAIIAEAPFMANPVLNFVDDEVLKYVAGKIYTALALGVTFNIIDAQTSAEAKAASDAAAVLKDALKGGSQDAIDKASDNFKNAFSHLVHFDGSAPV